MRLMTRFTPPRLGAAPSSPDVGEQYFDTTVNQLCSWTGVAWVPLGPLSTVASGGALPTTPFDGQEVDYVADVTNGVIWRFRYRAASASSFKWEFVGGSPLYAAIDTQQSIANVAFANLATVGPTITCPLAGDYMVEIGAELDTNNGAGNSAAMSYSIGAAAASETDRIVAVTPAAGVLGVSLARARLKTGFAAATQLVSKYRSSAGTASFSARYMLVTPVRVSG